MSSLRRALHHYPDWLMAHARAVLLLCLALAAVGAALAATLPLHTEFSWLLPEHQPSVIALRQLTARKPASAVIEIGIASPDPQATRRFAEDLAKRLRSQLPPALVREVEEDDGPIRSFIWAHRHLYASEADLERARDALKERISREEGRQNPLFVDLDDDAAPTPSPAATSNDQLADLKKKLDDARARAQAPAGYVAEEGKLRMLVVRCPFGDTEPEKGQAALVAIKASVAGLGPASYHPQLSVGYVGDPVTATLEHDLILRDVVLSTVLCLVAVMALLLLVLRAPRAVMALCIALGVSCALTFGFTRLWVGHLNSSTAFLGSVVAGNGINFGIIFLARYLEERHHGREHAEGLRQALRHTALPTLVAAAAAGTAYLSLIITSFRGFSEFGIIAGSGMVLCWAMSFFLLPALLTLFDRQRPLVHPDRVTKLHLRGLLPRARGSRLLLKIVGILVAVGSVLVPLYGAMRLQRDPFEDDLRTLRSRSLPNSAPGQWSRRLDASFGRDQSGGFYIGAARAEDVPVVLRAISDSERHLPPEKRLFGKVDALPNLLPGEPAVQQHKLALLSEVRRLIDKAAPHLDGGSSDAQLLRDLRPPEGLRPLSAADLPPSLRQAFTERDGRVGLLLAIHPGPGFDNWSARSNRAVVDRLRTLPVPESVRATLQISGPEVIFVDMMSSVQVDGPRASLLSLVLVLALLAITFGISVDLGVTAAALFSGIFGMLGLMALLGLRMNFLNYIAVPITIGIGVDYPFNVVARLRQEAKEGGDMSEGLWATGSAVLVCSLTTIIGYAVLLISDNGAIRSFGGAAVLGELTSICAALLFIPGLVLGLGRLRARRGRVEGENVEG